MRISMLPRRIDARAAALAGVASVVAYTATMDLGRKLTGSKMDDLVLLGRPLVPNRPGLARPVGAAVHLANGAGLGILYAALVHDRFPGPAWLRGMVFLALENTALYPLTALMPAHHPAVADGQLDSYWSWPAYLESTPPHLVYGALVGPLYDRLRRRPDGRSGRA
jgi:hypothetical protein